MTNNRTRKEHLSYSRIARLYARLRLSQAKTNYPAAIRVVKVQSSRFIRMRVLREVKNGRLALSRTNRKRSSFATKHFQKKSPKIFDLHPPLGKLLSFVVRISVFNTLHAEIIRRHRLLTRKLKLSVGGQSDKRCLASPRACQRSDLLR